MDGRALMDWARESVRALESHRDEINALNVFPIPDSDTGTNLVFTMRAAVSALDDLVASGPVGEAPGVHQIAVVLARGSVVGARGNSGVILSQVLRGLAEAAVGEHMDSAGLGTALRMATNLVSDAVSYLVEGTIVTVLRCAADAIAGIDPGTPVARTAAVAADAAAEALVRTPMQLEVLGRAGVVDAGGLGLVVVLDALVKALSGHAPDRDFARFRPRGNLPAAVARRGDSTPGDHAPGDGAHAHDHAGHDHAGGDAQGMDFEVMYLVSRTDDTGIADLRERLDALGDSVVIVGDGRGSWSVHVHCRDAGAAVEAGLGAGDVRGIRVTSFLLESHRSGEAGRVSHRSGEAGRSSPVLPSPEDLSRAHTRPERRRRGVMAVAAGDGAAELFTGEGATVLRCDEPITRGQLLGAIRKMERSEVLVLPNGALPAQELVAVSAAARDSDHEVLLLASSSMVQGLAALAVHDVSRDAGDDAFTMSEAAAATRWGSLRIAAERALTYVGTCEPGDGLGLVGHEVIVIDPDPRRAVRRLVDLLLGTGGELVTILLGADAPAGIGGELTEYIEHGHPGVEVMVYEGGQPGDLLQLGVE
ncbi:DAK2 domain-containing protein [Rhodococcus triatomae]|nr:DAK2 domain-containing protein [Rhodococcus triatomae]QNG21386.1 DAK2 domain-containing protein [Rhodococcus triatomae]QNG25874.1 DAK2 domain-containing protein [Rhodococcus triatomae]